MKRVFLMAAISCLLATSVQPIDLVPTVNGVEYVSIIRLIATPESFKGKTVSTIGFLRMGSEGDLLFVSREDALNDTDNAVWIRREQPLRKGEEALDQNYVLVTGRFSAKPMLSGPIYGEISDTSRLQFWSDVKHPRYLLKQEEWGGKLR